MTISNPDYPARRCWQPIRALRAALNADADRENRSPFAEPLETEPEHEFLARREHFRRPPELTPEQVAAYKARTRAVLDRLHDCGEREAMGYLSGASDISSLSAPA